MWRKLLSCLLTLTLCAAPMTAFAEAKTKLTIGADNGEETLALIAAFQAESPDITVELVPNETVNRERVLKIGIAANEPVDVGMYWGTRLTAFSQIGMCKDLAPYIDRAWQDTMGEQMRSITTDPQGAIWGVPYFALFHVMVYNADMLRQYGFAQPKTWDDLTAIFERLKQDGIYGFCVNTLSMQDSIYGFAYSLIEDLGEGRAWALANGDCSLMDTPEGDAIRSVIELVKGWYDAGYWYVSDGNLNTSADDANAAFAQRRCFSIFNFSNGLNIHQRTCDFELGVMLKPVREEGMRSIENLETFVWFIPVNVPEERLEPALRFIRFTTGPVGQQIIADHTAVPVGLYELTIGDNLRKLIDFVDSGDILPGINPCRFSSRMQSFIKEEIFSSPCAGIMTIDETLQAMERIFSD